MLLVIWSGLNMTTINPISLIFCVIFFWKASMFTNVNLNLKTQEWDKTCSLNAKGWMPGIDYSSTPDDKMSHVLTSHLFHLCYLRFSYNCCILTPPFLLPSHSPFSSFLSVFSLLKEEDLLSFSFTSLGKPSWASGGCGQHFWWGQYWIDGRDSSFLMFNKKCYSFLNDF